MFFFALGECFSSISVMDSDSSFHVFLYFVDLLVSDNA